MKRYAVHLCGVPSPCPHDPEYVHESMMGPVCVPKDFSFTTGKSKTKRQTKVARSDLPWGYRYEWPGGCDAAEAAARRANLGLDPESGSQ